jgi:hypothetical protein
MKTILILPIKLALLITFSIPFSAAFAQGTAFNYQGRLNDGGSPATGIYDLRFAIYDAVTNGNVVAGPLTNSATGVTNGLFAVTLDFGTGVFTGAARWLEVDVRTNGGGAFTTLLPLQPIQPVPYAIMANTASNLLGALPAAQLSGTIPLAQMPGAVLTNLNAAVVTNTQPNVTLSTNFLQVTPGVTNYSYNTLWVTNCGYFPFLNGLWTYNSTRGFYTLSTNYFYYDTVNGGWEFTWSTNQSPDGLTWIFEYLSPGGPTGTGYVRATDSSPDTSTVFWNAVSSTSQTNLFISNIPPIVHFSTSGDNILEKWNDEIGLPLFEIRREGDLAHNGFLETFGARLGEPYHSGDEGETGLRLNGGVANYVGGGSYDERAQLIVGFFFGGQAEYGGNLEFLVRKPYNYSTQNNSGEFFRNMILDTHGGATFGDSPYLNHGIDTPATGYVDIWPSTILDKPELVLRPGALSLTNAAGSLEVWTNASNSLMYSHTNNGVLVREPVFVGSNASGLTNLSASAITGGFNTNILVGEHTFYITNGIIMNVQ